MAKVRVIGTMLIALAALSVIAAPATVANGRPLKAELTGANEVPGPGDPDGSGVARLRLNQGRHRICYRITVADIGLPAMAAHIHVGTADVAGPVVVTLDPPLEDGTSQGCVTVERRLVKAIRKNRSGYYVNVHNEEFPDGAIRGQLTKWAPGKR
jgi:CHRD domain